MCKKSGNGNGPVARMALQLDATEDCGRGCGEGVGGWNGVGM